MEGFIYPNETEVAWSIGIVVYTYITGLVAGSFVIASLHHVFGIHSIKPVARFCLVCSISFLLVAPLPLLFHAAHPERAMVNMFFTPNLTSAMAGFGFIWFGYLVLVTFEVLLVFRRDVAYYARTLSGPRKWLYMLMALGIDQPSEKSLAASDKVVPILALAGIPGAVMLHGYVGFIFGSVKANAWWSTPLMPIIFLLSAVVSGVALVMVLYSVVTYFRERRVDHQTVEGLGRWLLGFLAVDLTLESLEILSLAYEGEESWEAIYALITGPIAIPFLGIQLGLGAVVPMLLLGLVASGAVRGRLNSAMSVTAACLVLLGVLAMRWNVIIGGQLLSKSLLGFTTYVPELLGLEGILVTAALLSLPFVIFVVALKVIPPWGPVETREGEPPPTGAEGEEAEERRHFAW